MVAYTVDLIGINHVGLGTDFYSGHSEDAILWWRAGRWSRKSPLNFPNKFSEWPTWFRSPKDFNKILTGLKNKGFNEEEIKKISGLNWLSVFSDGFKPHR